jgi:hypothetical protein
MLIQIFLSLTLIFNLAVPSQKPTTSKPDFTGIWNARVVTSDRASVAGLQISYRDPKLEIVRTVTSREPTIVMGQSMGTRSSTRFVYYTDGRGESQKSIPILSEEKVKSKTERLGDRFVITSEGKSLTFEVSSDGKSLSEIVTWLSDDGTTRRVLRLYDRSAGNETKDINGEWIERVSDPTISLTVEHRDPEIKVTRREVSETKDESEVFVYYTDGRGETNTESGRAVKSVTKWKDQTLVFTISKKSKIGQDRFEFRETIKWQIGKDGQSLVEVTESKISASAGTAFPPPPRTLIYARSAKPLP